jgi:hypothetical protein
MAQRWTAAWVAVVFWTAAGGARAEGAGQPPDDLALLALAVALSASEAQASAAAPPLASGPDAPPRTELAATVRAKALRLDEVPDAEPLLALARRTSWTAERLNLPARPEPGVIYRDVEIRLTVAGELEDVTALLEEARRAASGIRLEPEPPSAQGDADALGPPPADGAGGIDPR